MREYVVVTESWSESLCWLFLYSILTNSNRRDEDKSNNYHINYSRSLYLSVKLGIWENDFNMPWRYFLHEMHPPILGLKYSCFAFILCRDTATYRPLMKTNFVSHSLKYLTKTYLGQVTCSLSCFSFSFILSSYFCWSSLSIIFPLFV